MLEQKDFINVEERYKKSLEQIKKQLKKGSISELDAVSKAKKDLNEINHRSRVLELMLSSEKFEKITALIREYENFISTPTQNKTL